MKTARLRWISALALTSTLGLALPACDDASEAQPETEAPAPEPEPQPAPEPEPQPTPEPEPEPQPVPEPDPQPTPEPTPEPEPPDLSEQWRVTTTLVETGGYPAGFQLGVVFSDDRQTMDRVELRVIVDNVDTLSPPLTTLEAVPVGDDGAFTLDFGDLTLPRNTPLSLALDGRMIADDFWCGAARGALPSLGITLEDSAFGAAPWPTAAPGACPDGLGGGGVVLVGGERPAELFRPAPAEPGRTWPLVVLLHGYTGTGRIQLSYLQLLPRVAADEVLLLVPDGSVDNDGANFWNGRTCCGFNAPPDAPDDLAYLTGLIDEVVAEHGADPARVYLIGHSNGGFMSFDLACLAADKVTGIASLAGSVGFPGLPCPGADVATLVVHGTADDVIRYDGADWHRGAEESVGAFVANNGCGEPEEGPPLDLDVGLEGAETAVLDWRDCRAPVSLWTLADGAHSPDFDARFGAAAVRWLLRHPGPAQ